jgi:pimeloyl-ACP methyl ester carboxylesterase
MIVFLHGVPETGDVWNDVRSRIDRPTTALRLPGFGCPRPDGFGATKDDYVEWILGAMEGIDEPIDLVGHDWGAGFTYRIATAFGDRIRSWAADIGNIAHPDYVWHAFAQLWQTPGDGEAFFAGQDATPAADRAAVYQGLGVPAAGALEMATAGDAVMGSCILDLYRSATPNAHAAWGPWSPTSAPGLIIHPSDDPFSDEAMAGQVAASLGAGFEVLPGAGHFWPYQAPGEAVEVLEAFWAAVA